MQGIVTKYHGPTNVRGARVSARCEAGSIMVSWDHALDVTENHRTACRALCRKLDAESAKKYGTEAKHGWSARVWGWGSLPDGTFAHIPCSERMTVTREG